MSQLSKFSSVALTLVVGLTLIACTEEIKETPGVFGTEANPETVQKAISDAFTTGDILSVRKGQYIEFETNVQVEQTGARRSGLIRQELRSVEESPTSFKFNILQDLWKFDYRQDDVILDEKHGEFSLTLEKELHAQSLKSFALSAPAQGEIHAMANTCDGDLNYVDSDGFEFDCIRYFNLVNEPRRIPPPETVAKRVGCNNLPDCMLDIQFLQFDEVYWRDANRFKRNTVTAQVAPAVPDLNYQIEGESLMHTPPVYSLCVSGPLRDAENVYKVTQCTVLRDFQ